MLPFDGQAYLTFEFVHFVPFKVLCQTTPWASTRWPQACACLLTIGLVMSALDHRLWDWVSWVDWCQMIVWHIQSHKDFTICFFTVLLWILQSVSAHRNQHITTANYVLSVFLDALNFFTAFLKITIYFFMCQWRGMRIVGCSLKLIYNGRTCWGSCVMRTGQHSSPLQAGVKEKNECSSSVLLHCYI